MIFQIYQLGGDLSKEFYHVLDILNGNQTLWKLKKRVIKIAKPSSYNPNRNLSVIPTDSNSYTFSIGVTKGKVNQNNKLSLIDKTMPSALISEFECQKYKSLLKAYNPLELFWAFALANVCFRVSISNCSQENCLGFKDYSIDEVDELLLKLLELQICKNCQEKALQKCRYQFPEIKKLIDILRRPKEYNSFPTFNIPKLPVLERQIERQIQEGQNAIFDGFGIIIVMHFLEDLIPFLKGLIALGAKEESMVLLVKPYPYSQRSKVHSYLYKNHQRIRIEYLEELPPQDYLLKEVTEYCCMKSTSHKIIVIEDGGYIVPFIHKNYSKKENFCIGAVEQTTKGLNKDMEITDFYFPILNVAKSEFKDEYESPLVGNAVVSSLQRLLSDINFFGRKALVVGFGSIGRQVAESLKKLGMIVKVIDSRLERVIAARVRGFEAVQSSTNLEDTRLIIGTTGELSIKKNILENMQNNTVLVSTSSDQIEIDIKHLKVMAEEFEYIEGLGTYYKKRGTAGDTYLLLGDGYPINFYSGSGIPNEAIDPILTQLFIGGIHLALTYKKKKLTPTILNIMDELNEKYKLLEDFIAEYNS